jgi:hypothetical protein
LARIGHGVVVVVSGGVENESGVPLTAAPRFYAMCHGTHYHCIFSAADLLAAVP